MPWSKWLRVIAALVLSLLGGTAQAQMNPDIADKLRAMGRVVNPPATAPFYAGRVVESEPYKGVQVQRDIAYGLADRHLLDLFVPQGASGTPRPVFMFVHGGAFTGGFRRGPNASPFYDNIMLWAVRNGMIGVNLTYRLAPQNPWPAGAQDLGAAVRWVNENIKSRGGDPKRVYLMGHSAGAVHVASYVAQTRFHQVPGSGLAGALMLSGLYDMATAEVNPPFLAYFGPDASQRLEQSSLPGLLTSNVPLWISFAELDPLDFEKQANQAKAALCEAGRCPAFKIFQGHSHMSEIYSIHTDDKQVGDAMLAFVKAN